MFANLTPYCEINKLEWASFKSQFSYKNIHIFYTLGECDIDAIYKLAMTATSSHLKSLYSFI